MFAVFIYNVYMKIGVLSDSHKNTNNLKEAFNYLKHAEKVDLVIHLGDDYSDTAVLQQANVPAFGIRKTFIVRVPGAYDPEYKDPKIPNRMIKEYGGWNVLMTHTPKKHENDLADDINPELAMQSMGVDIVLYGHTHVPKIEKTGNAYAINPGHLKDDDKKGFPPSFAILEVTDKSASIRIVELKSKKELEKLSMFSTTG